MNKSIRVAIACITRARNLVHNECVREMGMRFCNFKKVDDLTALEEKLTAILNGEDNIVDFCNRIETERVA